MDVRLLLATRPGDGVLTYQDIQDAWVKRRAWTQPSAIDELYRILADAGIQVDDAMAWERGLWERSSIAAQTEELEDQELVIGGHPDRRLGPDVPAGIGRFPLLTPAR